jgi:hypothetical protein
MSALFVAPEGAMQFEVTHPETKYRGEVFWVRPTSLGVHTWNWTCTCDKRYEVLMDSLSKYAKEAFKGDGGYAVCSCVGRIIE